VKKESSIHCDELVSLPKAALTDYVGSLRAEATRQMNSALAVALSLDSFVPSDFLILE
jgi:mRNA interferase MazF